MTSRFRSPGMYLAYLLQAAIAFNVLLAVIFKPQDVLIGLSLFLIALLIYVFSWKTKIMFPWFVYSKEIIDLRKNREGWLQIGIYHSAGGGQRHSFGTSDKK